MTFKRNKYETMRADLGYSIARATREFAVLHGLDKPSEEGLAQLSTPLDETLDQMMWFYFGQFPEDSADADADTLRPVAAEAAPTKAPARLSRRLLSLITGGAMAIGGMIAAPAYARNEAPSMNLAEQAAIYFFPRSRGHSRQVYAGN